MRFFLLFLLFWPLAAGAQDDGTFLDLPGNPLEIAVIADKPRSVTARIGPEGGQIAAETARGEGLVLTIPPGALTRATDITLTPIAESAGLPGNLPGIVGGIMRPEGLEFAIPATLEIRTLAPMALGNRLHWGFRGMGEETMLHLPDPTAEGIVIPLDHFSGAGVTVAALKDLQTKRWLQSALEDRIETELARLLQLAAKDATKGEAAVSMIKGPASRALVLGLRQIAEHPAATCADAKRAVAGTRSIERQRQLLGIEETEGEASQLAADLSKRLWDLCLPEAEKQCRATGDLHFLTDFFIQRERERQLMHPEADDSADPARMAAVREALQRCGRYKLTVEAKGHWEDNAGVYGDVDFKVEVPIQLTHPGTDPLTFDLIATAPATDVHVTFVDYACWKLDNHRLGNQLEAKLTDLIFDDTSHAAKSVKLTLRAPQIYAVTSCDGRWGKKTIESLVSRNTWGIAHRSDRKDNFYEITTMKPGTYPKIFVHAWEGKGSDQGTTANDTTRLTLEHVGR